MATQQSLLEKPGKSLSKTFWLILSVATILCSSLLIASYLIKPTSLFNLSSAIDTASSPNHVCEHAIDTASCLAHVSEVAQPQNHKLNLLQSILIESASNMHKAIHNTKHVKLRINSPKEQAALADCEELMDLSMDRVWDSIMALTKKTTTSMQDAHSWLSSVLTNHVTCLDGLEGSAKTHMEAEIKDLISRSRTSLALIVAILPPNPNGEGLIDEPLNGGFPSWVTRKDRKLLESSVGAITANVVVAKDGSGKFKTVKEAVASAPEPDKNDKTRYVIYVKKGTYKENVQIGKKKRNVMLVGDGKDATVITGSLNIGDGSSNSTFHSATVGVDDAAEASKFTVKQLLIQGDDWLKDTGVTYTEGL
ncbi:hypothetical protein RIF29_24703 [Crotalaria pallida]|uniref:Pectinesterase inhibitor domain-containing protein n=1 Tax=Crotalaria pallida TaxID=3830 RepID=A0AAN9I3I0_CROPI